jgi:hypothetical protein
LDFIWPRGYANESSIVIRTSRQSYLVHPPNLASIMDASSPIIIIVIIIIIVFVG